VPGRLGLPCRAFDLLGEQLGHQRGLGRPDDLLLRRGAGNARLR
jgi:hypothetical protein